MNMFLLTTAAAAALIATAASAQTSPAAAPTTSAATQTVDLTVNFTGIATASGMIALALFDSEAAFDHGGAPMRQMMVPVSGDGARALLRGLPAGRYGIKAFHDVNGDGRMGTNPFGMPTEPYAFSNNAIGNMGPARWADASIDVRPGAEATSITIR